MMLCCCAKWQGTIPSSLSPSVWGKMRCVQQRYLPHAGNSVRFQWHAKSRCLWSEPISCCTPRVHASAGCGFLLFVFCMHGGICCFLFRFIDRYCCCCCCCRCVVSALMEQTRPSADATSAGKKTKNIPISLDGISTANAQQHVPKHPQFDAHPLSPPPPSWCGVLFSGFWSEAIAPKRKWRVPLLVRIFGRCFPMTRDMYALYMT